MSHEAANINNSHLIPTSFIKINEKELGKVKDQVVDVLTKPLVRGKFEGFRKMLGIVDDVSLAEREC